MAHTSCTQVVAKQQAPPGIAMEVNVLTSGYWPTYPVLNATLPAELALGQQVQPLRLCLSALISLQPVLDDGHPLARTSS